uniref:Uncharacterized protein n=1 Tax=Magallana gigas TaxID=29159 RepID=K1PS33_MAGGI
MTEWIAFCTRIFSIPFVILVRGLPLKIFVNILMHLNLKFFIAVKTISLHDLPFCQILQYCKMRWSSEETGFCHGK